MQKEIISYITALRNCMDRQSEMVSTTTVVDHLDDLLDFIQDIPEQVMRIAYSEEDGSDGMDEINRFLLS